MVADATRIKNISSHYIRAQQAECEGEDREELRHLLFAAQDIAELLEAWVNDRMEHSMAASYAESLCHSAARIQELIGKMEHSMAASRAESLCHSAAKIKEIINATDNPKHKNR